MSINDRTTTSSTGCQALIDRLLYAMAGLTEGEIRGFQDRLAHML